ncbi:class I adenylate-forming enzyme family protein [Streptomyces gardneri]|uniref:class I adenylate-forming enzyme family protein n=1 Tax=Streptomyces gardneri TaxID=66892 RepID=UPI00368928E1
MSRVWPSTMPAEIAYPDVGADALLAGAARAYPNRTALRDGDATLTFAALHDRALRIAAGLRARGLGPGDVVALHLPNSMWYVVVYYGALCAGLAVAPVNPAQPADALRAQLAVLEADAVVTHPACAGALRDKTPGAVRLVVHIPGTAAAPVSDDVTAPAGSVPLEDLLAREPLQDYRVDPAAVAHLQLTGGTTGRTKAVRLLHRNLVANVLQTGCWRFASTPSVDAQGGLRVTAVSDPPPHAVPPGAGVSIAIAPLFHGLGLVGQNLNTLFGATAVITAGRFDADRFLADIETYGVTHVSGSPAMYYGMLRSEALDRHDLTSVRLITSGAAPIDTTALRRLREVFDHAHVHEAYGLSEATMGVTMTPPGLLVPTPPGSVGVPVPDTDLQVRDERTGEALPSGATGVVWVRGPQVADGYLNDPDLTATQFVDGWLCTGDMGRIDDDGFLFLMGRSKDMLIYKGYNVYPQPLEEILCGHHAIVEAAVVGRQHDASGEIPVGFVVLRAEASEAAASRGQDFLDEVMAHVAERVAPYQRIRELHIVERLPLTPTGKVLKTELRGRVAAPYEPITPATEDPAEARVEK